MGEIVVSPAVISIAEGSTQAFTATLPGPPDGVTWSLEPTRGAGSITADGVYRPPRLVLRSRSVTVVAASTTAAHTAGRATISLSPIFFWTHFLGLYWLAIGAIVLGTLITRWDNLCPSCGDLLVSPPIVTLGPGQIQHFRANGAVRWSPEIAAPGIYRAPDGSHMSEQRVTVTATSTEGAGRTATASVYLSKEGGLIIEPTIAILGPGETVDLVAISDRAPPSDGSALAPEAKAGTAAEAPAPQSPEDSTTPTKRPTEPPTIEWMRPQMGELACDACGAQARFVAPKTIAEEQTIVVIARSKGVPSRVAGAAITLAPERATRQRCDPSRGRDFSGLLVMVALMGALGGLIHGVSSFTTYVGNRELLPSWIWWYAFKPALSALVAIAVYLVFRAGWGSADYALDTADCVRVSAFAVLIGLFAENATLKLKDIFETIFTPRRDPRLDKAGTVGEGEPHIDGIEPARVAHGGQGTTLKIKGSNFSTSARAAVAGELRDVQRVSGSEITLQLTEKDLEQARTIAIVVYNEPPQSRPSNSVQLEVQ